MNHLMIHFEKNFKKEKQKCKIRMLNLQIIEFSVIVNNNLTWNKTHALKCKSKNPTG